AGEHEAGRRRARRGRRRRSQAARRFRAYAFANRRAGTDRRREVRVARAEVGYRAGMECRAHRRTVGAPDGTLVLYSRVAAGRVRLVVAGTPDSGERRSGMAAAAPRIALIHALAHSIAPVNAELDRAWPGCVRMNLLDDSLSSDLAASGNGLGDAMTARFIALAAFAVGAGVRVILFTCSAFGPCIDAVARRHQDIPVLKPNEAMIADAVRMGRRSGLVGSVAATLA